MQILRTFIVVALLGMATVSLADEAKLPPPVFKASLVCFNGDDNSGSSCRSTMAKIEDGLTVAKSKLTCGVKGAVSEITWTYRGRKEGKDLYHVIRRYPSDTDHAQVTEKEVSFDGTRQVLFKDGSQCIVMELQPVKK